MKRILFAALLGIFGGVSASHAVTIQTHYDRPPIEFDPALTISGVWEGLMIDGTKRLNPYTKSVRISGGVVTQTRVDRPGFAPVGTPLTNLSSSYVDVAGENYLWMTIAGTRVGIDFLALRYDAGVRFFAIGRVVSDGLTRRGREGYIYTEPGTFDASPLGFTMYFTKDPVSVPLPPMAVGLGLSILGLVSLRRLQARRN